MSERMVQGPISFPRALRTIPLARVLGWKDNPASRMKRDRKYMRLLGDISRRGMIDPIDVVAEQIDGDTFYRIVRGHQRTAVARELGWDLIEAWEYFLSFERGLALLQPTEYQRRVWGGTDNGLMALSLGVDRTEEALIDAGKDYDAKVLRWAYDELAGDMDVWRGMLQRSGMRPFMIARRVVNEDWSLARVCRAVLAHGSYRDLERKGMNVAERRILLAKWEEKDDGTQG